MKKIALLLVACLTVATFAVACGSKEEEKATTTKATTTEKETTTEAETTTEEATTEAPKATYTDNGDGSETLYSPAWWDANRGISKDYALAGDGSVKVKVVTAEDTAAFSVELYNVGEGAGQGYYLTTGSDGNAWVAELLTGAVTCPFAETSADPGKFVAGNTYEITVTRAGNSYTVVYYDVTAGAEMYKMTAEATVEAPADLAVRVMSQVGTITVSAAE